MYARVEVTDVNAAFFDACQTARRLHSGRPEILRRQGLLEGTWCLNPNETLSPASREIDRIYHASHLRR